MFLTNCSYDFKRKLNEQFILRIHSLGFFFVCSSSTPGWVSVHFRFNSFFFNFPRNGKKIKCVVIERKTGNKKKQRHLNQLRWKWSDTLPALHNSVLGMTVGSPCPAMQVSLDMHTKPEEWSSSSFLRNEEYQTETSWKLTMNYLIKVLYFKWLRVVF